MKPIKVKALEKYRIWILFDDGISGEVDLSDVAGQGIFKIWDRNNNFKKVFINNETEGIAWNNELEICPETIYLQIKKSLPGKHAPGGIIEKLEKNIER